MASYTDIAVRGSVENVQNLVQRAFVSNGFDIKWEGPTKGKAEKGSRAANFALGALAQHYRVEFEIYPAGEGSTLRLHKANTGLAGGIIGVARVNKQFNILSETLASWFGQQGVLLGMKKA